MYRRTITPTHARLRALLAACAIATLAASSVGIAAQAAQAAPLPTVVINEVESSDTVAKDWVELKNVGSEPVDVSGWIVKDNNDSRVKAIPADTTIAPGG
ncbi:lamin tail domain-containing protein, partial [Schumannella luteola]